MKLLPMKPQPPVTSKFSLFMDLLSLVARRYGRIICQYLPVNMKAAQTWGG